METPYGTVSAEADGIACIQGQSPFPGKGRLFLRNGEVLTGVLQAAGMGLTTVTQPLRSTTSRPTPP